jgi:Protein of unknown function (DUF402)
MPGARASGDHVVLRQLHGGRIWTATPAVVVEDTPERVVLWLPEGRRGYQGAGRPFGDWTLEGHSWSGRGKLIRVSPSGRAHSILHFWHRDGSFRGWYVNLEEPLRRTPLGFDFEDHLLDVWIEPDGRWRWLDEDELAEGLRLGAIDEATAAAARAEGERVLAEWPFPTGYEHWTPPSAWRVPELPPGWDEL